MTMMQIDGMGGKEFSKKMILALLAHLKVTIDTKTISQFIPLPVEMLEQLLSELAEEGKIDASKGMRRHWGQW